MYHTHNTKRVPAPKSLHTKWTARQSSSAALAGQHWWKEAGRTLSRPQSLAWIFVQWPGIGQDQTCKWKPPKGHNQQDPVILVLFWVSTDGKFSAEMFFQRNVAVSTLTRMPSKKLIQLDSSGTSVMNRNDRLHALHFPFLCRSGAWPDCISQDQPLAPLWVRRKGVRQGAAEKVPDCKTSSGI